MNTITAVMLMFIGNDISRIKFILTASYKYYSINYTKQLSLIIDCIFYNIIAIKIVNAFIEIFIKLSRSIRGYLTDRIAPPNFDGLNIVLYPSVDITTEYSS